MCSYVMYSSSSGRLFLKYFILVLFVVSPGVYGWDEDELEIFDVVEEVNENFYTVMGIAHDAPLVDVKKAYRSLSKVIHPDKNDAPDAEVKFRQLVSIYEILRDEGRRARYDRVLVEGLPDWRSPIYYYRRARKMSLIEICIILTVVISITQYLMAWGTYLDRRHTLEEFLIRKLKIKDKKKKRPEDHENMLVMEQEIGKLPKPSWWNILPIQIVQLVIFLVRDGPSVVRSTIEAAREEKLRKEQEKQNALEMEQRLKEEEERRKERKAQNKIRKKVNHLPDYSGEEIPEPSAGPRMRPVRVPDPEPVITGGPWCDDDFSELSKLMNRFPGGTLNRWDKIAEMMNRTVFEVTTMSKRVKAELLNRNITPGPVPVVEEIVTDTKTKQKTRDGKLGALSEDGENVDLGSDEHWSPLQQKILEKALKMYPKGTDQRWDKISNNLSDKSKGECMLRFKFLAEKIRKKKEEEEKASDELLTDKNQVNGCEDNCDVGTSS